MIIGVWPKGRVGKPIPNPQLVIIVFSLFVIFPILMLKEEKPKELAKEFKADLAMLDEGRLEEATVFFSDKYEAMGLESLGGEYADTVVRYGAIEYKGTNGWLKNCIDFKIDTEHCYNERESVAWNEEYSTSYRIKYTPCKHIITEIEIAKQGKIKEGTSD